MTMHIDPKTRKITYSDPKKTEAFGKKVAEAMVAALNRKIKEGKSTQ